MELGKRSKASQGRVYLLLIATCFALILADFTLLFRASSDLTRIDAKMTALHNSTDDLQRQLAHTATAADSERTTSSRESQIVQIEQQKLLIADKQVQQTIVRLSDVQTQLQQNLDAVRTSLVSTKAEVQAISIDTQALEARLATIQSANIATAAQFTAEKNLDFQFATNVPEANITKNPGPVYNAIYQNPLVDGKAYVQAYQPTFIKFYIGSASLLNALTPNTATPNDRLISSKHDLLLNVKFSCEVCIQGGYQSKAMTYRPDSLTSDTVEFDFTPGRIVDLSSNKIIVSFIVEAGGYIYDEIPLPLYVKDAMAVPPPVNVTTTSTPPPSAAELKPKGPAPPPEISIIKPIAPPTDHADSPSVFRPVDKRARPADIIVSLIAEGGDQIVVQVEPRNLQLATRMRSWTSDEDGHPRLFERNINDVNKGQITQAAENVAISAQKIVNSRSSALKALMPPDISKATAQALEKLQGVKAQLTQDELDSILAEFRHEGEDLYTNLFLDDGGDLAKILESLESFELDERETPKRPIRILILTRNLVFPWQFLKRLDSDSNKEFWGYKYEIIVKPIGLKEFTSTGDAHFSSDDKNLSTVFATYTASIDAPSSEFSVSTYGSWQYNHFKARIPASEVQLHPVASATKLKDALSQFGRDAAYMLVFAHGANGIDIDQDLHVKKDGLGTRLIFSASKEDYLTPQQVEDLKKSDVNRYVIGNDRFLREEPIVILNTCNSGNASVFEDYERKKFPQELVGLGASGVIATEAPMWDTFAYEFGNALIDSIANGTPLSLGLTQVRRQYLDSGNPLGLFYSYYGGSSVTVDPKP